MDGSKGPGGEPGPEGHRVSLFINNYIFKYAI